MKRSAILICLALAGYFGWQSLFPSVTVHYRLTLQAEVDGRPVRGSGIIAVSYSKVLPILGESRDRSITTAGEAVALDLGRHGVLFALLKEGGHPRSGPEYIVPLAFGFPDGALGGNIDEAIARVRLLKGEAPLAWSQLPLLVRFRDPADPKTVERVDPGNIAAIFGPGVRFAGASIQITRDPVTRGIANRLSWLSEIKKRGGNLDGTQFTNNNALSNYLNALAFESAENSFWSLF